MNIPVFIPASENWLSLVFKCYFNVLENAGYKHVFSFIKSKEINNSELNSFNELPSLDSIYDIVKTKKYVIEETVGLKLTVDLWNNFYTNFENLGILEKKLEEKKNVGYSKMLELSSKIYNSFSDGQIEFIFSELTRKDGYMKNLISYKKIICFSSKKEYLEYYKELNLKSKKKDEGVYVKQFVL